MKPASVVLCGENLLHLQNKLMMSIPLLFLSHYPLDRFRQLHLWHLQIIMLPLGMGRQDLVK